MLLLYKTTSFTYFLIGCTLAPSSDRLSAQDLLSIRKVQEYVCPRLFGNKEGKVDNLEEQAGQVEVQCMDQVGEVSP